MHILNSGRSGLGGGCVGGMKRLIRMAADQAENRKQFGEKISSFMMIKEKLALMTMKCFVAESFVTFTSHLSDSGVEDYSIEAAASKVFATEALWEVADEALQIAGGNGFMKEFPYERLVRDSRINRIFEGTSEILRLFIALNGFEVVGKKLTNVSKAFEDPIKGFGLLKDYASSRVSLYTGIGVDELDVSPELEDNAEIYVEYSLELAKATDALTKKYRKEIIGKQLKSKRIADVAINLMAGLATLSRVDSLIKEKGAEKCQQEIKILNIFTQQAKRSMNQSLRRLERNEDDQVAEVADFIFEEGSYPWDVL